MNFALAKILGIACFVSLLVCSPMAAGVPSSDSSATALSMQEVPLRTGEPFLRARSRVIKLGWKPIRIHQNDGYEYSGTEKELAEKKILEVDACSVDAGVLCSFYYSKAKRCLRVNTVGENVAQMTVTRWVSECPPPG